MSPLASSLMPANYSTSGASEMIFHEVSWRANHEQPAARLRVVRTGSFLLFSDGRSVASKRLSVHRHDKFLSAVLLPQTPYGLPVFYANRAGGLPLTDTINNVPHDVRTTLGIPYQILMHEHASAAVFSYIQLVLALLSDLWLFSRP